MSMLSEISARLERLEAGVGAAPSSAPASKATGAVSAGQIDVVLGAQWGDEGKGKV